MKDFFQYNRGFDRFPLRVLFVLLTVLIPFQLNSVCVAASDDQTLTFKVKVLDPDGNPVEDARVTFWPLGIAWKDVKELGPQPTIATDGQGLAELNILADTDRKRSVLSNVGVTIDHPDFVLKRFNHVVHGAEENVVSLERGFRIAATVRDGSTGGRLEHDLFAKSANYVGKWQNKNNGTLVSPMLKMGSTHFRVMQIGEGYPDQFSDLISVKSNGKTRLFTKDIKLFPAVRVEGRLDESVARPVIGGYVSGKVVSREASNPPKKDAWAWYVTAKIKPDGTFVFDSIPRNSTLQMIPFCDGWNSVNPLPKEVEDMLPRAVGEEFKRFLRPHVVDLRDRDVSTSLPMEQMAKVTFRIQTAERKPIAGARLHSFPSQVWYPAGTQYFGAAAADRPRLLERDDGESVSRPVFDQRSDENGKVTMLLPTFKGLQVWASHPDYEGYLARVYDFDAGKNPDVHIFFDDSEKTVD